MIPAWLVIGTIALLLGLGFNALLPITYKSPRNYEWFMRLRRPAWLTFEKAIPAIWITIFLCGIGSAWFVWEAQPPGVGWWMLAYAVLELVILAYMPVLCGLRSLKAGTLIGATGWLLGALLAVALWPISPGAVGWLMPYLLWSPIGTYVTWEMAHLNPGDA